MLNNYIFLRLNYIFDPPKMNDGILIWKKFDYKLGCSSFFFNFFFIFIILKLLHILKIIVGLHVLYTFTHISNSVPIEYYLLYDP